MCYQLNLALGGVEDIKNIQVKFLSLKPILWVGMKSEVSRENSRPTYISLGSVFMTEIQTSVPSIRKKERELKKESFIFGAHSLKFSSSS